MATLRICSIPDCGKPWAHLEWCNAHYLRWYRHGDPLGGSTPHGASAGSPASFYRKTVLTYEGDECLTWPFATGSNRAVMMYNCRLQSVSRLVCEYVHGPAPTPKHEAAHSCGKGHEACVAKRHLSWKTPVENQADKILHGTHQRGEQNHRAKLTEADVREILVLKGTMLQREIANLFGIDQRHVSDIHRGTRWGHISKDRPSRP